MIHRLNVLTPKLFMLQEGIPAVRALLRQWGSTKNGRRSSYGNSAAGDGLDTFFVVVGRTL